MPASTVLVFLFVWAIALSTPPDAARAQQAQDPENTVYATGAVFETEKELAGKPRTPLFRAFLPVFVDLGGRFPVAGHQGKQGSCVAWAVGYAARSYYNSAPESGPLLTAYEIPSPAYIYDSIRRPGYSCDRGARISDALNLLMKGAVAHAEYRYDPDLCRRPGASMVAIATRFRIAEWRVVDTGRLDQVKAELANGHPVIIGMRDNRAFHRLRGRRIWRAGYPEEKDGHHAITVVGYSERGQYFKVMNSWGTGWGSRGFGRISYDTFEKRVKRGFSMRLTATPPPPPPEPPPPKPKPVVPKPEPPPVVKEIKLPEIGCGRLQIVEKKAAKFITGFVGTSEDLDKVKKAAAGTKARLDVALRPWPQCEALMTVEKPLARADGPSITLPKRSYRASDTLAFEVKMPGFRGYLHLAYIQADGSVVNLVESDPLTLTTLSANKVLKFGDGKEGRRKFTVGAPFGNEMILAVASKSPLFSKDRPLVETEREFLTALQGGHHRPARPRAARTRRERRFRCA